ncbi:MAG: hypothetical protein Q9195_006138 [Heterodermia aff. obscurata]
MAYSTKYEAELCLDSFEVLIATTKAPRYSHYSNEVPQSEWQHEFERLKSWNAEMNSGQTLYDGSYMPRPRVFSATTVNSQQKLLRGMHQQLFLATVLLRRMYDVSDSGNKGNTDSGKKMD